MPTIKSHEIIRVIIASGRSRRGSRRGSEQSWLVSPKEGVVNVIHADIHQSALFRHLRGFANFISTMVRVSEGYACVSIILYQQLPRKNSKSKLHYLFGSTGQSLWGGTHLPSDVSRSPFPNPPYIGAWQVMVYEYLNAADMNWQADLQNTNLMNPIK